MLWCLAEEDWAWIKCDIAAKPQNLGRRGKVPFFPSFFPSLPGSLSSQQGIRRDTCPGGKTSLCLPPEEPDALTTFYGNPVLPSSWKVPRGRKELRINGGRADRASCSPSQAQTTGPTSLPKSKEENLARPVSIANLARCMHNQIILLFSCLFAYFFPRAVCLFAIFASFSPKFLTEPPTTLTLISTGIPIKSGPYFST